MSFVGALPLAPGGSSPLPTPKGSGLTSAVLSAGFLRSACLARGSTAALIAERSWGRRKGGGGRPRCSRLLPAQQRGSGQVPPAPAPLPAPFTTAAVFALRRPPPPIARPPRRPGRAEPSRERGNFPARAGLPAPHARGLRPRTKPRGRAGKLEPPRYGFPLLPGPALRLGSAPPNPLLAFLPVLPVPSLLPLPPPRFPTPRPNGEKTRERAL